VKHLLHPIGALLISLLSASAFPLLVALLGTTLALCVMVAMLSLVGPAIWLRKQRLHYAVLFTGLALAIAIATLTYTHSIFLTVWCFLLVLWVFQHLLTSPRTASNQHPSGADSAIQAQQVAFLQAQRTAEAALDRMAK
jgi:hypothetical protein